MTPHLFRIIKIGVIFFSSAFLISCATATPDIHLRISGTEMEINRGAEVAQSLAVSTKNNLILVGSVRFTSSVWDISKGQMLKAFRTEDSTFGVPVVGVRFLPDENKAVTFNILSQIRRISIWDLESGRELKSFQLGASDMAIAPDGKHALVVGEAWKGLGILDLETGEMKQLKGHSDSGWRGAIYTADISPDGKYGVTASFDKSVRLWDMATGEEVKRFMGHEGTFRQGMVNSARFSPDGRYIISAGSDTTLRLWEVETGQLVRTFRGHTDGVRTAVFSPDGKMIISGGTDSDVRVWDVATGQTIRTFKGHSEGYASGVSLLGVAGVGFTADNRCVVSTGDATIRVWSISTGQEIATMIRFNDNEWLSITPEGYYNSSPNGHQYMNLIVGKTTYSMEQFYDVFYRPDIVAAKLRGEDISGLITITMQDAMKSPPPVVEFAVKQGNPGGAGAKVCYQVKSAGGGIGEVRLFHNGKLIQSDGYYKEIARSSSGNAPLASLDGKAIYTDMRSVAVTGRAKAVPISVKPKGDFFENCREIDAVPGENEVSIAAFNRDNTVQSALKSMNFKSAVPESDPHLYILSIGIDNYRDGRINLKYAVKDARDIEEKLNSQSATLYKPGNIHFILLTDREATKANITGKITGLAKTIRPRDSFILFAAGHGVLLQNQYYMLTHDFDGNIGSGSMISSNEIVEMSKKIKSLNQLYIFDTCHAGGVDTIVSGLYDARMSVLAKKMGLHIYASANDRQAAMDGYKGNGLFTHTLLDGLNNNREADRNKDGTVTIVGLGEFSKKKTALISKELGREQTPLIINFGKDSPLYRLN